MLIAAALAILLGLLGPLFGELAAASFLRIIGDSTDFEAISQLHLTHADGQSNWVLAGTVIGLVHKPAITAAR